MKPLPFKMRQETEMEKFRHDSFWTKEFETLAWIESFEPNSVFFDVGANIGIYSLYAASLYPEMPIYAFEPMPMNYRVLNYNNKINRFDINTYCCAVGMWAGDTIMLKITNYEVGSSGSQMQHEAADGIPVELVSIDYMADTERMPDYVKIDIDGQELDVVIGMKRTLPYIKSILVEVSKTSRDHILDILSHAGFTTDNRFNKMVPHSRERREKEGIDAENIVFTR